jgi:hypothetical protein
VWAPGPYREAFATDNLTIAVVTPMPQRRDQLREWTLRELTGRQQPALADLFLFTAVSPVTTKPLEFFLDRLWYPSQQQDPVRLLNTPEPPAGEVSAAPV